MIAQTKKRLVKLGMVSTVFSILFYAGFYFVACKLPILALYLLMQFTPGVINTLMFRKTVTDWRWREQIAVFACAAALTTVCYGVFIYFLEQAPDFEALVRHYAGVAADEPLKIRGRFFNAEQIGTQFLLNTGLQFYFNKTDKEYTIEEIERILEGKKKPPKKREKKKGQRRPAERE